jgi:hypothetical protein
MRPEPPKPFFLNKVNSQATKNIASAQQMAGNAMGKGAMNSQGMGGNSLGKGPMTNQMQAMAGNVLGNSGMNAQMTAFLKKPSVAGANKLVKQNPSLASSGNPFAPKGATGTGKVKISIRK